MPALVAGIHALRRLSKEDVDGGDKPGYDEYLKDPWPNAARGAVVSGDTQRFRRCSDVERYATRPTHAPYDALVTKS
jgi:hypothetical protein